VSKLQDAQDELEARRRQLREEKERKAAAARARQDRENQLAGRDSPEDWQTLIEPLPLDVRLELGARREELVRQMGESLGMVVIRAEAKRTLFEHQHPEAFAAQEEQHRLAASLERRRRMEAADFPGLAIDAVMTGRDEQGEPLVLGEAEAWLRSCFEERQYLAALVGLVGTGKTVAACKVAEEDDRGTLYTLAVDLVRAMDRYDRNRDRQLEQRARWTPILIVDECGTQEENGRDSAQLAGLVRRRFDAKKVTIMIGNLMAFHSDEEEARNFEDLYGDPVMSRAYHSGGVHMCTEVLRKGEQRRQDGGW